MDFQMIINLLLPYWGIITSGIGFVVYALFQRENAKKIILSIMLRLEKEAESLALQTGDDKLEFMLDKGYQLLPGSVRIFLPQVTFNELAKSLYDKAKGYLIVQQSKNITSVELPVENVSAQEVKNTVSIPPVMLENIFKSVSDKATLEAELAIKQVVENVNQAIATDDTVNKSITVEGDK